MNSIRRIILAIVACLFLLPHNLLAEDIQEFIEKFNIDRIDKDELHRYSKRGGLLNVYMLCLAGFKEDVSICNNLNEVEAKLCSINFYLLHDFSNELIQTGMVTAKAIRACERVMGMKREECQKYSQAFLTGDILICEGMKNKEKIRECKAIITRDNSLCPSSDCRDQVFYIKAVTNLDIKICDKIKNESIKMLCKVNITKDENTCKQCEDFKKFTEVYYSEKKQKEER